MERAETRTDNGRSEFHRGSFARILPLQEGVQADTITALHVDGILEPSALVIKDVPVAKTIPIAVSDGERS